MGARRSLHVSVHEDKGETDFNVSNTHTLDFGTLCIEMSVVLHFV